MVLNGCGKVGMIMSMIPGASGLGDLQTLHSTETHVVSFPLVTFSIPTKNLYFVMGFVAGVIGTITMMLIRSCCRRVRALLRPTPTPADAIVSSRLLLAPDADVYKLRVEDLKEILKVYGCPVSGLKPTLQSRVQQLVESKRILKTSERELDAMHRLALGSKRRIPPVARLCAARAHVWMKEVGVTMQEEEQMKRGKKSV